MTQSILGGVKALRNYQLNLLKIINLKILISLGKIVSCQKLLLTLQLFFYENDRYMQRNHIGLKTHLMCHVLRWVGVCPFILNSSKGCLGKENEQNDTAVFVLKIKRAVQLLSAFLWKTTLGIFNWKVRSLIQGSNVEIPDREEGVKWGGPERQLRPPDVQTPAVTLGYQPWPMSSWNCEWNPKHGPRWTKQHWKLWVTIITVIIIVINYCSIGHSFYIYSNL